MASAGWPRFPLLAGMLLLGVALAACDGGESDAPAPAATPTATPTASAAAPTASGTPWIDRPAPTATRSPDAGETDDDAPAPELTLFKAAGTGNAGGALATQVDTRIGTHEGFDRFVMEFENGLIPQYTIEYIDPPATQCASGMPVELAGGAVLQVTMPAAYIYDPDRGVLTIPARELAPGYPTIFEAQEICGFEAVAIWVLGVSERQPFAVHELSDPARLVIDIAH